MFTMTNIHLCGSCNNTLDIKNQQMASFDVGPNAPLEAYRQYQHALEVIHHVPCNACNFRLKFNIPLRTWNIFKCVLILFIFAITSANLWSNWYDTIIIKESDSNTITCECDATIYHIEMNTNLCNDASFIGNYIGDDKSYDESVFFCKMAC
eukprot:161306_1